MPELAPPVWALRTLSMSPRLSAILARSRLAPVPSNQLAIKSSTALTPAGELVGLSMAVTRLISSRMASTSTGTSR
jgi:hypothetical protein